MYRINRITASGSTLLFRGATNPNAGAAGEYNDCLSGVEKPLILYEGESLSLVDSAFQVGDTNKWYCRYFIVKV